MSLSSSSAPLSNPSVSTSSHQQPLWQQALPSAVLLHLVVPLLRISDVSHLASTCSVWRNALLLRSSNSNYNSNSSSCSVDQTQSRSIARFTAHVSRAALLLSLTQSPLRFHISTLHLGSAAAFASDAPKSTTKGMQVADWWPSAAELSSVAQALPHLHTLHTQIDFRHPFLAPWRASSSAQTRDFPSQLGALHIMIALPSRRGPLNFWSTSQPHGLQQLLQDVTRSVSQTLQSLTIHIHDPTDTESLQEADLRFDAHWLLLLRPCERLATFRLQAPHASRDVRDSWTSPVHIANIKQLPALTELEMPATWDTNKLEQLAHNDGSKSNLQVEESSTASFDDNSSFSPSHFILPGPPLLNPALQNLFLQSMALTDERAAQLARFPSLRVLDPRVFCVPHPWFLTRLCNLEEIAVRGTTGVITPPVDSEGRVLVPLGWRGVQADVLCPALRACIKLQSLTLQQIVIHSAQLEELLPYLPNLKHLGMLGCKGFTAMVQLPHSLESLEVTGSNAANTCLVDPASSVEIISRLQKLRVLKLRNAFDAHAVWSADAVKQLQSLMESSNINLQQCVVWPVPSAAK